jgi:ABC-2 type transport system permease protein
VKLLLSDTWLLLALRRQVAWNRFRSRRPLSKVLIALVFLAAALASIRTSTWIAYTLGTFLRRVSEWQLEGILPGLVLTATVMAVLVGSFGVALSSLFLSDDLDLLMSAPVDRRAVFVSKLLDGMGWYYAVLACTALPGLIAYGLALGYGLLYFVLALPVVLGAPLLPAGVGAVLVMLVARFAPARRVREVLGLVAALFGVSCSIVAQLERTWTRQLRRSDLELQQALATLQAIASLPIPSMAAGQGLAAAGAGDTVTALSQVAGFLLLTFGGFGACVWLADVMYSTGWARLQGSSGARRDRARAEREAARAGWLGRVPAALAIAIKDWWVITRDLRNWAQLLTPLVVLLVVYVNLLLRDGRDGVPAFGDLGAPAGSGDARGLLTASGILTATVLVFSRIAATSISREGRSWWLLKASPLTAMEVLSGKLAAAMIPFALLSTALMALAAVWLSLTPLGALYGWFALELIGSGMLALCVAFGVPSARLDWDDPRHMSSGWGALAAFVACGLLAAVAGTLLSLPILAGAFWPQLTTTAWVFGPGAATVLIVGVIGLALSFGSRHLADVGES